MGRGQGTAIRDQFSSIFGNKRGLGDEGEGYVITPVIRGVVMPVSFAAAPGDARRRMRLVQWCLGLPKAERDKAWSIASLVDGSGAYEDTLGLGGPSRMGRLVRACQVDMEDLSELGIFVEDHSHVPSVVAHPGVAYKLQPVGEWPEDHRSIFRAWQGAAVDAFAQQMSAFAPDVLDARRLLRLSHWLMGNDKGTRLIRGNLAQREICKKCGLYGYPQDPEAQNKCLSDLDRLVECEVLSRWRNERPRDNYTMKGVGEWPLPQQEAFETWKDLGRPE